MTIDEDRDVHERRIRVRIGWAELEEAVHRAVADALGIYEASAKHLKVTIEQETEGSPAYNVQRWRAIVQGAVPLDTPAQPQGETEK